MDRHDVLIGNMDIYDSLKIHFLGFASVHGLAHVPCSFSQIAITAQTFLPIAARVSTSRTTTGVVRKTTSRTTHRVVKTENEDSDLGFQHGILQASLFGLTTIVVALHILRQTHDHFLRPFLKKVVAWDQDLTDGLYTYDLFSCEKVRVIGRSSLWLIASE